MANNLISYDLPTLQRAKAHYESYAREINTMMGKISGLVDGELHDGWKGDSYDSFKLQNDTDVKKAFEKMRQALDLIAKQIATAEQNARIADEASRVKK